MRTLVLRLDNLGDVLLAGPAVRAVAAGSSSVTMLCGPQGAAAARLLPGIDEVLVWEAPWVGYNPPEVCPEDVRELLRVLTLRRFDRALVLTSYHQSPLPAALLLRLAGVPRIVADSEDYPGSLLDLRHQRAAGRHEVQAALDLAAADGFPLPRGDDGRLRILTPPSARPLTGSGAYVVVHPGASVPARMPSAGRMASVVRALTAAGHRVVVTGGPDEVALTAAVAGGRALDLGGRTGLAELAGVLAGAEAVVVGNTGPAHLAAAVGAPVVSLFSPVVPVERWRPYGVRHVILGQQNAACAGSRARRCPVPGHPCLDSITSQEIVRAVDRLVASQNLHTKPPPAREVTA
ncbi:glycosyltransferase family 9 protein [Streptantibioticus rubrisoli]|uniref:Glycosyltransferase family 9 protein n=1 Tax=Streptantibioticus rubrisoli TaxID=1387313 RepID=A0ABT1PEI1_9ACTN|nr:glycosyltransferase family 9 protein [Streptantibioticus rubrisoli]MCQ4043778.1 glycosyltransferase family 9 protein [Streptantibioticus rubrisoli]